MKTLLDSKKIYYVRTSAMRETLTEAHDRQVPDIYHQYNNTKYCTQSTKSTKTLTKSPRSRSMCDKPLKE